MENLVQQERRDSSMDIESYQEITIPDAQFTSNTIPDEDIINSDSEFPAPPAPAELEKLSMEAEDLFIPHEDPMITIPRTLKQIAFAKKWQQEEFKEHGNIFIRRYIHLIVFSASLPLSFLAGREKVRRFSLFHSTTNAENICNSI